MMEPPPRPHFESSEPEFDRRKGRWTVEAADEDGTEWEYEAEQARWVRGAVDEATLERQQAAYGTSKSEMRKRKRKTEPEARVNTAVYVTQLPDDVTEEELAAEFGKCGVLNVSLDTDRPRITIYRDEAGRVKGDALIVYLKAPSVTLAVQMLDEADLRPGVPIRVQPADASYRKRPAGGEAPAPIETQSSAAEKRRRARKLAEIESRLADWDDVDGTAVVMGHSKAEQYAKVAILKHVFTLSELDEDPSAALDIKEEVREECQRLGPVTSVVLYDKEPDGVVSVKFSDGDAAAACVDVMNGRWFGGRRIEAHVYNGRERYKKTSARSADDTEEQERLERFGDWLEEDGGGGPKEESSKGERV